MRVVNKIVEMRRKVMLLLAAIYIAANVDAYGYILDCQTEVEGVQYLTDYYQDTSEVSQYDEFGEDWEMRYTLERKTKYLVQASAKRCQAEIVDGNKFLFYDGSMIPTFLYAVTLEKRNHSRNSSLPNFDPEKDEVAQRSPYYTGDVWLQDSVQMQALPDLRKTKYHIVYDLCGNVMFGEELISVRTPRYAVVREGVFRDCTGLRTARIGAAQCVETDAFENCVRLGTVFFESSPYVETDAFRNCPNIRCVVMDGKLPQAPEGSSRRYDDDRSPFGPEVYEHATLYVHADQMEGFRNDKTWGKFKNIRDIEEYISGVGGVMADTVAGYDVYDLSGAHVRSAVTGENWREGLPAGVYIVKSSLGTVRKEYIK